MVEYRSFDMKQNSSGRDIILEEFNKLFEDFIEKVIMLRIWRF